MRSQLFVTILSIFLPLFSAAAEPPRVVATTSIVADLVRNVGGDLVQLTSLMGPGIDPHLYRATPSDLEALRSADLILYSGLHLEGKMQDIFDKLSRSKNVAAVTSNLPREQLRTPPEFEGNFDPHVWFDVQLWSQCAAVVRDKLSELLPSAHSTFQQRHDEYVSRLIKLHQDIKQRIQTIPAARRLLITAHDAFGYFGRAYGLEVVGLQGISTATEYGLRDVSRVVDIIVSSKVPAIFVESSVSRKFVTAIQEGVAARGHSVVVGGELYSDALGAEGSGADNYIGTIEHNVRVIVEALS
ncbi:MAG: zinc ABC transporter substrate-binding protein [Oligoflexia bacterium]|nr:zinc ABC transporter substrate-binding protein [Oligoflexia bacterium]